MLTRIDEFFTKQIHSCAIAGHVNPDGDCVGSVAAMYLYIRKYFPWIDVRLYLEQPKDELMFLPGLKDAIFERPKAGKTDSGSRQKKLKVIYIPSRVSGRHVTTR